jgi:hypothetical protein
VGAMAGADVVDVGVGVSEDGREGGRGSKREGCVSAMSATAPQTRSARCVASTICASRQAGQHNTGARTRAPRTSMCAARMSFLLSAASVALSARYAASSAIQSVRTAERVIGHRGAAAARLHANAEHIEQGVRLGLRTRGAEHVRKRVRDECVVGSSASAPGVPLEPSPSTRAASASSARPNSPRSHLLMSRFWSASGGAPSARCL